MLLAPKGYEYWEEDGDGNSFIRPDAPDWAKEEFEEYQKIFAKQGMPDEDGIIRYI